MSYARSRCLPVQGGNYYNNSDFRSSSLIQNVGSVNSEANFQGNSRKLRDRPYGLGAADDVDSVPPWKRRKSSASSWEEDRGRHYFVVDTTGNAPSTSSGMYGWQLRPEANFRVELPSYRSESLKFEDEEGFMSRDEIERCSPSRKDGIDLLRETHLRYSYCTFLQNLGLRLELPQTTVATAMVLCHRFFVRRSHACHDRFLIATAAVFLAAKSEETPRPLNNVLKASYEICYKQDLARFPYLLPANWFEPYRERVIEAEQMILMTLNFELNVQHPYVPLTSALNKLGLSRTVLVNLAWTLVNEGVLTTFTCSSV